MVVLSDDVSSSTVGLDLTVPVGGILAYSFSMTYGGTFSFDDGGADPGINPSIAAASSTVVDPVGVGGATFRVANPTSGCEKTSTAVRQGFGARFGFSQAVCLRPGTHICCVYGNDLGTDGIDRPCVPSNTIRIFSSTESFLRAAIEPKGAGSSGGQSMPAADPSTPFRHRTG